MAQLTDMNDVPLLVKHDVAIVPVLDLQQEQQEAVCGHASDEVVACLHGKGCGLWGRQVLSLTLCPHPGGRAWVSEPDLMAAGCRGSRTFLSQPRSSPGMSWF